MQLRQAEAMRHAVQAANKRLTALSKQQQQQQGNRSPLSPLAPAAAAVADAEAPAADTSKQQVHSLILSKSNIICVSLG